MEQEKQLTTQANSRILNINKPSRYNSTSDLRRTWKVVLNGGGEVFLTETELEFYLAEKERGATHVMFKDFGLTTNYKLFAKNEDALRVIRAEQEEALKRKREQELEKQFTPEQRERNLKAWQELKIKMRKSLTNY